MFYDERIELEKGLIYRRGLVLAVGFALLSGILRGMDLRTTTPLPRLLLSIGPEFAIALTGLFFLSAGVFRKNRDERDTSQQYLFYNRVGPLYIQIIGLCYALLLPLALHTGGPLPSQLEPLLFLESVYLFYSFKRRQIPFNYALMDHEHYYRGVGKNIGKLGLYVLVALIISLIVQFLIALLGSASVCSALTSRRILEICKGYLPIAIGGGILYFLLSFLEKESNDTLYGLSRASGFSLLATVAIYAIYALSVMAVNLLTSQNPPLNPADRVYALLDATSISVLIKYALVMFLIYFTYEYQRNNPAKGIRTGCELLLLTIIVNQIWAYYQGLIQYILLSGLPNQALINLFLFLTNLRSWLTVLGYFLGGTLLLVTVIRQRNLPRGHLMAIPAATALIGMDIFLDLQADYLTHNHFLSTTVTLLLIYLCYIVFCIIRTVNKNTARTSDAA